MYIIENESIALTQYTHDDDHDMYLCWEDLQTQKGFNYILNQSFEEFKETDINRFKFWVTVIDKNINKRIGVIRLGLDDECLDLAIWIYPQYRNNGYGTKSFRLALEYIFENYAYQEISAGCYCDNTYSSKMLNKLGFVRFPEGDKKELNCFTGKETIQLVFKITKCSFLN